MTEEENGGNLIQVKDAQVTVPYAGAARQNARTHQKARAEGPRLGAATPPKERAGLRGRTAQGVRAVVE